MSMGWDNGEEAAELFHQKHIKADFDEWMSGRYWLGDKAPAEGFYGRYSKDLIPYMKQCFDIGTEQGTLCSAWTVQMSEDQVYLMEWARDVGESLTRKMNENIR